MLTPRPYQIVGRDFLASRTRALLADEMRVGKTPQAILAAEHAGYGEALVLCPAIAVPHWQREWEKWAPDSDCRRTVLSYDRARALWQAGDLEKERWDVLIVDEAHFCKNPRAIRTRMVYGKGGLGHQVGAIWALSGTPAPKHAGELWPMLRAFGATDLTYDGFVARYCTRWWHARRREWVIKGTREERIPELKALLAPIMLRRTRREVAPDMPDIDFQFLYVEPTGKVDLPASLGKYMDDEEFASALEAHAEIYHGNRQDVAMAKVSRLVEEIAFNIENGLLARTVVFGWHKAPLVKLAYELETRGITTGVITGETPPGVREQVQAAFREGQLQVVCANILAAGTAIDLSAASHAYFLEMSWVPGENMQAANRLVSMNKQEKVTVDVVTWPGSTDDRVQRVLTRRVREINQLM